MGGLTDERIAELQAKTPEDLTDEETASLELLAGIETEYERAKERLGLFLPFIQTDTPNTVDTDTPIPYYEDKDGSVVQLWEITPNDPAKIASKIGTLKSELAATDYRVIKSQEYALAGLAPEYDIASLHAQRQGIRDEINTLNTLIQ